MRLVSSWMPGSGPGMTRRDYGLFREHGLALTVMAGPDPAIHVLL